MKFVILSLSLWLLGCADLNQSQSLESYFKNTDYVQEQKNSSNEEFVFTDLNQFNWALKAFAERCEWFDLERVVDGDTIIVRDEQTRIRVRMIGIDTPESKKAGTPVEPFALEASNYLKDYLAYADEVCLVEDRVGDKYDTYGRKLSYVFTPDGHDVNAYMLREGYAEAYTGFAMERAPEFEGYEAMAQNQKIGQWSH